MSAVSRPWGLGPSTDPGLEGWDALGMGVHFNLGNGQPGGLLGNLPWDQRLKAMHAGDANADWPNSMPDGFNREQADLSALGPNYGANSKPVSPEEWDRIDNDNLLQMQKYLSEGVGYTVPLETARQALTNSWQGSGFAGGYDVGGADKRNPLGTGNPSTQNFAQPQTLGAPLAQATFDAPLVTGPQGVQNFSQTGQATPGSTPTLPGGLRAPKTPGSTVNTSAAGPGQPAGTGNNSTPLVGSWAGDAGPGSTTGNTMPLDYYDTFGNTGAANMTGTGAHTGAGAYGLIPGVPDPVSTANQAIYGNLANLGGIEALGSGLNSYNESELLKQYETALPGFGGLVAKSSSNIADKLAGRIPADVLRKIDLGAAEGGIGSGSYLDDNQSAAYLQALGLTSLDLQNQAENQLTGAIKRTPTAQLFNPTSFLISPEAEQNAQWAANQFAAAPDPAQAAAEAERRALAGIQAGKNAAGGGGGTILPGGGGGGAINPVTGNSFNPFSGGGSLPKTLGGGTNVNAAAPKTESDLLDWWNNTFGSNQIPEGVNGTGVEVPYAGGYSPALDPNNQFNYDSSFLDSLGLGDTSADEEDWASLFE